MRKLLVLLSVLFALFSSSLFSQEEKSPDQTWHDCVADGRTGNQDGYLSMSRDFVCKEGRLRITGKWGEEIQNGWQYQTEFGEPTGSTEYIGDLPKELQMPKFQKWCPTKFGFSLCGWNEEEQARQEQLRRMRSHHIPPLKKEAGAR